MAVVSLTALLLLLVFAAAAHDIAVIGAGLARTGSNSFKAALDLLLDGDGHTTHSFSNVAFDAQAQEGWREMLRNPDDDNNTALLLQLVEGYEAVNGPPAGFFYKRLIQQFPDAKVVLTQHPKGPHGWYQSTMGTIMAIHYEILNKTWIGQIPPLRRFHFFGREMYLDSNFFLTLDEWQQEEVALKRYADWTQEVVQEVPADRLLIFNVSEGWEPLCAFLGKPVPDVPFPVAPSTGTNIRRAVFLLKTVRVAVPAMLLLLIGWLCRRLLVTRKGKGREQHKKGD